MEVLDIIKEVVNRMVTVPEKVSVQVIETQTVKVYQIEVDKADMKWLIGKDGRFANSLRHIIWSLGKKEGRNAIVEIMGYNPTADPK
jgi:predicted RNA-binding protein YlqC (UPF0109 family)